MLLNFTKMHGCGNDFIVINCLEQAVELTATQAQKLADRRFGIGCDQILLVGSHADQNIDFSYRIINADGSEVNACGNGARCFLRFVIEQKLTNKKSVTVATAAGVLVLSANADDTVTVDMGVPKFAAADVPIALTASDGIYQLNGISFSAVSMGNPHAVIRVDDCSNAEVLTLGQQLGRHEVFPEGANIGFMQIINDQQIKLRVYERGVGETLACGTGACAAVVSGIQLGLLASNVMVNLSGGDLNIKWNSATEPVFMTGAAQTVYQGTIEI